MTRAGLMSVIYHRTTELHKYKLSDSQAVTLMGTDAERVCNSLQSFHGCWISVIEIALAAYLLEREVSLTCVVPVVVSVGSCMPLFFTCHKLHANRFHEIKYACWESCPSPGTLSPHRKIGLFKFNGVWQPLLQCSGI